MTMTAQVSSSDDRRLIPKKRKRINCPEITTWLSMVEKGKVKACVEQHQLAAYVRRVFANEELIIDYRRIELYGGYQKYFPFELFAWEWFCFALFMCVFKADGKPRWPDLFMYLGRGAGKNGFIAFIAFCAVTKVNGILHYNVDICANSEEQAKTSFDDIHEILESDLVRFKKGFRWNREEIVGRSTRSKIKYRTDNPKSKDGMRPGLVIFDEVHAYQDVKNIKVFTTGLGKCAHPRRLFATTDGDVRDGVLDKYLEKSRKILSGERDDNGWLPFICKLDNAEQVHDPTNWEMPNPSVPFRPDLFDQIKKEYYDFLDDPAENADFMTKRMNLPSGNPDIEVAKWDDILATNREMPDLRGMPCVCGIDFARTNDFIAAVLLFRIDDVYYAIHHSWVCSQSKDIGRIKAPLSKWESMGILTIVDDVEIHPYLITEWIEEQRQTYDVVKIAIDSYRHGFLMRELGNIGFYAKEKTVKLTRPSDVMLVQTKINSLFINHLIVWGDDPAMRWYVNNTKLEAAAHGNYTYGKIEPKSRKTDGFMAFVAAMTAEDAIPDYCDVQFFDPIYI